MLPSSQQKRRIPPPNCGLTALCMPICSAPRSKLVVGRGGKWAAGLNLCVEAGLQMFDRLVHTDYFSINCKLSARPLEFISAAICCSSTFWDIRSKTQVWVLVSLLECGRDEEGVCLGVFMLSDLNADLWDPDTNLVQKPQQSVVIYCICRERSHKFSAW